MLGSWFWRVLDAENRYNLFEILLLWKINAFTITTSYFTVSTRLSCCSGLKADDFLSALFISSPWIFASSVLYICNTVLLTEVRRFTAFIVRAVMSLWRLRNQKVGKNHSDKEAASYDFTSWQVRMYFGNWHLIIKDVCFLASRQVELVCIFYRNGLFLLSALATRR